MGKKQNRCSKQKREQRRIDNANIFQQGFDHGYSLGHQIGFREAENKYGIKESNGYGLFNAEARM